MESLLFTLATVVARRPILSALANNPTEMWEERNKFATLHFLIVSLYIVYTVHVPKDVKLIVPIVLVQKIQSLWFV